MFCAFCIISNSQFRMQTNSQWMHVDQESGYLWMDGVHSFDTDISSTLWYLHVGFRTFLRQNISIIITSLDIPHVVNLYSFRRRSVRLSYECNTVFFRITRHSWDWPKSDELRARIRLTIYMEFVFCGVMIIFPKE